MKIFVCNTWIMKKLNVCLQNMNYDIFVCITWIMKIFCLQYMNNENIKMFVCNTWIMKKWKYLLSIQELWKYLLIHELWKYSLSIHEIWKHENVCLQYMNYENGKYYFVINYEIFCLQNINLETRKIFVCNTWIMKIWKYLYAIHESWKYLFAIHKLWKQENICLQYKNYE